MVTPKSSAKTEKKTAPRSPKPKVARVAKPAAETSGAQVGNTQNPLQRRRLVVGTVVSDKMQKTIVVSVDRRVRHSFYKKYIVKSRRFKAHDEKNDAKIGDRVSLVETRPMSREKRWVLQSILRRAGQVAEANI